MRGLQEEARVDVANPLVELVRKREPALSDAQALVTALEIRRNYAAGFRKLGELATMALGELDEGHIPEGVATRFAEVLLADGESEVASPFTSTITDIVRALPPLLARIMDVLRADPIDPQKLRELLGDLVAMSRPTGV